MNDRLPLISCVCITGNAINLLQRAVVCFKKQTYPNKELILIYDSANTETNAYAKSLNDPEILAFPLENWNTYSLGEKRNYSIEKSNGDFFCQWDDDDWYHPNRIKEQLEPLLQSYKEASILIYEIVFDEINKSAYGSTIRPMEHSILCRKSVYYSGLKYSHKNKGEDFDFITSLLAEKMVLPVINPGLYIYVYHGKNTFPREHFNSIFNFGFRLTDSTSSSIAKILSNEYSIEESAAYLKSEAFLKSYHYFNKFPYK